jgi:ribosomal protein L40E
MIPGPQSLTNRKPAAKAVQSLVKKCLTIFILAVTGRKKNKDLCRWQNQRNPYKDNKCRQGCREKSTLYTLLVAYGVSSKN